MACWYWPASNNRRTSAASCAIAAAGKSSSASAIVLIILLLSDSTGMVCASHANVTRFETYCQRRENEAVSASLSGFYTIEDATGGYGLVPIGNAWTRRLFDGDFYRADHAATERPVVSLVFGQSRDGNSVADNPSSAGGGESDKHVGYEGLSRVAADAGLSGATTARRERMVFSVWHPELVDLRRSLGHPRHPAQVVLTDAGNLPIERGLMFAE